jgi:hypothetical protein
VWTSLPSAQQSDKKPDPQTAVKSTQSDSKPASIVPPPDPSPYTGEETRQFNKDYIQTQRDIAIASKETANYTFVLIWVGLGVGVLQGCLLFFQALYTGRAANAAKASADAVVLAERSWISLDKLLIGTSQPTRTITVTLKNPGRMPAHIVEANISVRCNIASLPPVQQGGRPTYDTGTFVPPALLVAGDESSMWFELSPANIAATANAHLTALTTLTVGQQVNMWIYGFVRYWDDLAPNTIHEYRWVRRYDLHKTGLHGNQRFLFAHENEPGYNYAD